MAASSAVDTARPRNAGMGRIIAVQAPERITAILGSCVGVAIMQPGKKFGVLAHVVLPKSNGAEAAAGKFADTAIPAMIAELKKLGADPKKLIAKFAGAACMFGASGPLQIGKNNVDAVTAELKKYDIPIRGTETGGEKGRRVTLDCETGTLRVEIVGQPPIIL